MLRAHGRPRLVPCVSQLVSALSFDKIRSEDSLGFARATPLAGPVRGATTLYTDHCTHTTQYRAIPDDDDIRLCKTKDSRPRRRCRLSLIVQATTSWRNSACGLYGALQLYTSCSLDTAYRFAVLARINSELYSCTRTIRPTRSEGFEKVHPFLSILKGLYGGLHFSPALLLLSA